MNINNTLQTDVLDIVFADRNKSYGAYQLRKTYNKRLTTALAVMIATCILAVIFFKLQAAYRTTSPTLYAGPDIVLQNTETHKNEPVQPPPVKPLEVKPQQVATIKVTTPLIVDEADVTPPPTQDDMEGLKIDLKTVDGDMGGDIVAPPLNEGIGGSATAPVKMDDYNKVFTSVQQQAQFPGGLKAWKEFLERNLRSSLPAENGAAAGSYTVFVSFLVDKTGAISEVKAENDPGYGTAAEAVRVIQRGPAWQPAVQNGRNVIYRQRQSITFQVAEM